MRFEEVDVARELLVPVAPEKRRYLAPEIRSLGVLLRQVVGERPGEHWPAAGLSIRLISLRHQILVVRAVLRALPALLRPHPVGVLNRVPLVKPASRLGLLAQVPLAEIRLVVI